MKEILDKLQELKGYINRHISGVPGERANELCHEIKRLILAESSETPQSVFANALASKIEQKAETPRPSPRKPPSVKQLAAIDNYYKSLEEFSPGLITRKTPKTSAEASQLIAELKESRRQVGIDSSKRGGGGWWR